MVVSMTEKENALHKCARMILLDQCPPDRKHYLCMVGEDDSDRDCTLYWNNYMWALLAGTVDIPREARP